MTETQREGDDDNCFVGIARCCGRVVFAAVDDVAGRKTNAKRVGQLIRDGFRVETWTSQQVRESKFGCKCKRENK